MNERIKPIAELNDEELLERIDAALDQPEGTLTPQRVASLERARHTMLGVLARKRSGEVSRVQ
jgi:hypothetical protein